MPVRSQNTDRDQECSTTPANSVPLTYHHRYSLSEPSTSLKLCNTGPQAPPPPHIPDREKSTPSPQSLNARKPQFYMIGICTGGGILRVENKAKDFVILECQAIRIGFSSRSF